MTTKLRRARSVLATALVLVAGVILAMRTADAAARTTVVAYFDNSNGVFAGDDDDGVADGGALPAQVVGGSSSGRRPGLTRSPTARTGCGPITLHQLRTRRQIRPRP